ncbi:MAG TPA: aspartate aminotransferase, partial [Chitinophagaceae bacterium]|nr:aspartate aminotransferase [Chitinophagaceae bacterium]
AAYRFYLQKEKWSRKINEKALQNFHVLKNWLAAESRLEYILPQGGVVCFPRIKTDAKIDIEKFYSLLMNQYKTMVGAGHWFEMPDNYMRIGFGWTDASALEQGLQNISKALNECFS